jgi:hypothetical protein
MYFVQTASEGEPDAAWALAGSTVVVGLGAVSDIPLARGFFSATPLVCCSGFMANLLFVQSEESHP